MALVVWAPAGIQEDELDALLQVRQLWADWTDKWRAEVRVAGVGDGVDVAPELYGPCRVWRSVTPFAPKLRYPKPSWDRRRLMLAGIRRELGYRGHADTGVDIEVLPGERGFRKSRLSKTEECGPSDYLRLTFDQPMTGPLALGHLCHFGLGLFVPDKGRSDPREEFRPLVADSVVTWPMNNGKVSGSDLIRRTDVLRAVR